MKYLIDPCLNYFALKSAYPLLLVHKLILQANFFVRSIHKLVHNMLNCCSTKCLKEISVRKTHKTVIARHTVGHGGLVEEGHDTRQDVIGEIDGSGLNFFGHH